jgi:ribosome-binding factor A
MASHRKERLEELIRQVIGDTLLSNIKDPRIGFTTVTRVDLSRDYSAAHVYISVLGTETEKRLSMAGLESAKHYIQRIVGKEIQLRVIPKISFVLDESIEKGVRMVGLIDELNKGTDEKKPGEPVPGNNDEEQEF